MPSKSNPGLELFYSAGSMHVRSLFWAVFNLGDGRIRWDPKPHLVMQIPQGKASNFQALLLIRASICTHPLRKGLPHGTRNG